MPLSALAGSSALRICGWLALGVVTESLQATETLTFRFGFHPRGSSLHLEQRIDVGVPMSYVQSLLRSPLFPHPSISQAARGSVESFAVCPATPAPSRGGIPGSPRTR